MEPMLACTWGKLTRQGDRMESSGLCWVTLGRQIFTGAIGEAAFCLSCWDSTDRLALLHPVLCARAGVGAVEEKMVFMYSIGFSEHKGLDRKGSR